jgi:anaerobic magnesium-protoporphyrin IX monomethyl ester cyclase
MNVLLLSMPDSFEHMPAVAIRMPNGALASLAGNIDRHHRVAIADLILVQASVRRTIERLVREIEPDLVGMSVMTFQRGTALEIARFLRTLSPRTKVVVGGYDPSLASHAYEACDAVDFIVRGEGELTLRELLRALESDSDLAAIRGLSYRGPEGFVRNPERPVMPLASSSLDLPDRDARVLGGYTLLGRPVDVVETSRGCTYDCSFCSIIEMRGRNFHPYPFDRVLADIADAKAHGARSIFLVDDNITLNVARFEALCQAIIDAGFDDIDYTVQAMTSPIAQHGARLAPLMKRAGFRYVFLGIENVMDGDLEFLRAGSKNTQREGGRTVGNASIAAIQHLHANGMYVVGGLIVGNPDDTKSSIDANLEFARRYVDWPYIQHPTPYPGTPMTRDFEDRGLIVDQDVSHYDGTTAVVRSEHLSADDIEFLRWRADRWMKVGHMPAALAHSPLFVLRNSFKMLAHTFAGSSLRSVLGVEDERTVFARYRRRRQSERAAYRGEAAEPATPHSRLSDGRVRGGNPHGAEPAEFH